MNKPQKTILEVQGNPITVLSQPDADFISLTDIARYRNREHAGTVFCDQQLDAKPQHH